MSSSTRDAMRAGLAAAAGAGLMGLVSLTGCAALQTSEQRAEAAQRSAAAQIAILRAQMQIDDMKCRSYGAAVGSQVYVQCRQQADQLRQQRLYLQQARPPSLLGALGSGSW